MLILSFFPFYSAVSCARLPSSGGTACFDRPSVEFMRENIENHRNVVGHSCIAMVIIMSNDLLLCEECAVLFMLDSTRVNS